MTDEELYKFIGLRIKAQRASLGMSQERLADRLRMTRTSISNIESGQQRVKLHTLYQIARHLCFHVVDMLPTESNKFAIDDKRLKGLALAEREWVKSFMTAVSNNVQSYGWDKSKLVISPEPEKLLQGAGVVAPPVPVDKLAQHCGASISYAPFDGEMSGLLYRGVDNVIIGINSLHSKVRQRFAIAHELGHLALHDVKGIHVDRNFSESREYGHSLKIDAVESEANLFAIRLLIPTEMVKADLKNKPVDFSNGEAIGGLAERYNVGLEVMTYRLTTLVQA